MRQKDVADVKCITLRWNDADIRRQGVQKKGHIPVVKSFRHLTKV